MAYDYLGLVNEVNRRLNEVELTTSTFNNAKGLYAQIKDAVNASLRDINQTHQEWPFNHVSQPLTLTKGVTRYAFPSNASTVDFESFRIKENATFGNNTVRLKPLNYDDYLQKYVEQEYKTDDSKQNIPEMVFQSPSLEFGMVPTPREAYELVYEYYSVPSDLVASTDVPTIPERFRHVIVEGAMYYAYMFRSNEQAAQIAKTKFDEGMKKMRILLINKNTYMRSTFIAPLTNNTSGLRVA
jgi:hypothetical protein